jgi:hypothetical protein
MGRRDRDSRRQRCRTRRRGRRQQERSSDGAGHHTSDMSKRCSASPCREKKSRWPRAVAWTTWVGGWRRTLVCRARPATRIRAPNTVQLFSSGPWARTRPPGRSVDRAAENSRSGSVRCSKTSPRWSTSAPGRFGSEPTSLTGTTRCPIARAVAAATSGVSSMPQVFQRRPHSAGALYRSRNL